MTQRENLRRNAIRDEAPSFEHIDAESVDDAVDLLRRKDNVIVLAGGTEVLNAMKNRFPLQERSQVPVTVVNIDTIDELYRIRETSKGLEVGALETLSDIASSGRLNRSAPALSKAAEKVASPQIRNQGTLGGNLAQDSWCEYYRDGFDCYRQGGVSCHARDGDSRKHAIKNKGRCITPHSSDTAPATLALDAQYELVGSNGRRTVDARDFFVGPQENIRTMNILDDDELITKVVIPKRSLGSTQGFVKRAVRDSWDFPLVNAATVLPRGSASGIRIALNGVAPTPIRAKEAERVIRNAGRITEQTALKAGTAFAETTDPMDDNKYKVRLAKYTIQESILEAGGA